MIHHLSIPAENPYHVAEVLSEVLSGTFAQFPPHPGSYVTFAGDEYGTAIEVYPLGTQLNPGQAEEQLQFHHNSSSSKFIATHVAISVSLSQSTIEEIGGREGWHTVRCNRDGLFDVIEFWLENSVLLELLTPEMVSQYIEAVKPEKIANFLQNG